MTGESLTRNLGYINGEPLAPGYELYEGAYRAPERPHKIGHNVLRAIVDSGFAHEISWEDVERRKSEAVRAFTAIGVDEEALRKATDPEHTDWILWDGPSPPEVLAVEALIEGRNKPKAVVFKDSPATRMPKFMSEPGHQSGVDHLVGHLVHFHMGGDGQDEYLSTRFQSLGIQQRIREGKRLQQLHAPLMAAGLAKHKNIAIANHFTKGYETVARFPVDAFSDQPQPTLSKWACDHTLVPLKYEDGSITKRTKFIRGVTGVCDVQPGARRGGNFWGYEELKQNLEDCGFIDGVYDPYLYDVVTQLVLIIEKEGVPTPQDIERVVALEALLTCGLDIPPPSHKPFTLTQSMIRGQIVY